VLKVFATTSHPFDNGDVLGLKVAVKDFYRSLILNSKFEKIFFFLQSQYSDKIYLKQLEQQLEIDKSRLKNVSFFSLEDLPIKLQKGEIDVIHCEDPKIDGLMQVCKSVVMQKKVVITGVTHSLNYGDDYLHFLNMLLLEPTGVESIVCTSFSAKKVLTKMFAQFSSMYPQIKNSKPPVLSVVPLGISEKLFDKLNKNTCSKEPKKSIEIIYLGRINSLVKADLRPFFSVIKKLANEFSTIKYTIAGGVANGQENELELLKREIISHDLQDVAGIIPNCSEEVKIELLNRADIFFSPVDNFQETFGLSVIEAMASGLPIVCSNWGGYKDIVNDGENGYLLKTNAYELPEVDAHYAPSMSYLPFDFSQRIFVDLSDCYDKLKKIINDEGLRKKMSEKSRELSQKYLWNNIIKQYEELWNELHNREVKLNSESRSGISQAKIFEDYIYDYIKMDSSLKLISNNIKDIKLPMIHPFLKKLLNHSYLEEIIKKFLENSLLSANDLMKDMKIQKDDLTFHLSYLLKYGVLKRNE
jgi:glycosyltransferase involved in cell wall biosynthesis